MSQPPFLFLFSPLLLLPLWPFFSSDSEISGRPANLPASLPPPILAVFHKEERSKGEEERRMRSRREFHLLTHLCLCFRWPAQVIDLPKWGRPTINHVLNMIYLPTCDIAGLGQSSSKTSSKSTTSALTSIQVKRWKLVAKTALMLNYMDHQ